MQESWDMLEMLRVRVGKENPYYSSLIFMTLLDLQLSFPFLFRTQADNNKCSFSNYEFQYLERETFEREYFDINNPLYRRFRTESSAIFSSKLSSYIRIASSRKRSRLRIADETGKGRNEIKRPMEMPGTEVKETSFVRFFPLLAKTGKR